MTKKEDRDLTLSLLSNARVVEYLVPTMSDGLLSKFPHHSSSPWDFDPSHTSSIWSPLVPRHYSYSLDPDSGCSSSSSSSRGRLGKTNKAGRCVRFDPTSVSGSWKRKTKRRRRSTDSEDDAAEMKEGRCGCIPFAGKGWNKMVRAASRHIRKGKARMKMKRKQSTIIRVKLSSSKLDFTRMN
ncbi:hypothetical protein MLD38_023968 [Melastoma candidum]|uniref:Uncharacterized protein n=1 Tax=Melastoma candidum TaxID=119954 RepID=A0ACB9NVT5_9MYRT|nr:hypothetical protein MLD38_023968 [Melastoma candidum]